jgi:hypothetical protein
MFRFNGISPFSIILVTFAVFTVHIKAAQLAFPGAEGFGRNARGGRDGNNYVVTSLENSGPGSLREGLKEAGRIITFKVVRRNMQSPEIMH